VSLVGPRYLVVYRIATALCTLETLSGRSSTPPFPADVYAQAANVQDAGAGQHQSVVVGLERHSGGPAASLRKSGSQPALVVGFVLLRQVAPPEV